MIIIEDMARPDHCKFCRFSVVERTAVRICTAAKARPFDGQGISLNSICLDFDSFEKMPKPEWCPLKEITFTDEGE